MIKDKISGARLCSEPSMIWTKLKVEKNLETNKERLYWPTYWGLSPKQRWEYLNWLKDITRNSNLSYIYLYFYGLERHLFFGNYDLAIDDALRIYKYHAEKNTGLRNYILESIIISSSFRKRVDIIKKAPVILQEVTNEALVLRSIIGMPLTGKDIVKLESIINSNHFIKKAIIEKTKLFEQKLQLALDEYQHINGDILKQFPINTLEKRGTPSGNISLETMSMVKLPSLLWNKEFQKILRGLLSLAYKEVTLSTPKNQSNKHKRTQW